MEKYFQSDFNDFHLLYGDTMDLLPQFEHKFDVVFAVPPYFLSNNGLSVQSGKIVSVNKGKWHKSEGFEYVNEFNRKWLSFVRDKMKDDDTIWISDAAGWKLILKTLREYFNKCGLPVKFRNVKRKNFNKN